MGKTEFSSTAKIGQTLSHRLENVIVSNETGGDFIRLDVRSQWSVDLTCGRLANSSSFGTAQEFAFEQMARNYSDYKCLSVV